MIDTLAPFPTTIRGYRAPPTKACDTRTKPRMWRASLRCEYVEFGARGRSVRRKQFRSFERANFSGHQAFWTGAKTRQQAIAGLDVGESIAPESFHMHEYIFGPVAARKKSETPDAIEPFDDDDLETADCRSLNMRARGRQLRRMDGLARFDRKHAKYLHSPVSPGGFRNDARALVDGLKAVPPQHCDVKQNIRLAIIRDNETVTFGHIEPFDATGDFYERKRVSVFCNVKRLTAKFKMRLRTVLAQFAGPPNEYSATQEIIISNK